MRKIYHFFNLKLAKVINRAHLFNADYLLISALLAFSLPAFADNTQSFNKEVSAVAHQALNEFYTPGMAVGIVYKDQTILAKGFGKANLENNSKVDENTLFRLASTSKAFTAAALGILVDQKKLTWNSKVIDYLPNFRLQDPYATREFTVLDLLTHRSGLISGAGDSMIWPEPSGFSRREVIANLQYLSPEYSFRSRYAYSNVLYVTAGELVSAISKISFDQFVEQEIFGPLNMDCFVGDIPPNRLQNVAMSYGHNDERGIYSIPRNSITEKGLMSAAAGGMVCSVNSMLKWANALLQNRDLPFSEQQLNRMWRGETILSPSRLEREWDGTCFKSYGLGWRLSNIAQFKVVSHTGTLSGYQAYLVLVPEIELGVIILNNGSNSAARGSVMQTILKKYLSDHGLSQDDFPKTDWIEEYNEYLDEREQRYLANYKEPEALAPMSIKDTDIVGEYEDQWFGKFVIKPANKKARGNKHLRIHSSRMSTLVGTITPFQDKTYKIEWDNKNAASDAFMHFDTNVQRQVVSAKLHPFAVNEYINHAYRDMHFVKVLSEE